MIYFTNFDNTELKISSKLNFCFRTASLGGSGLTKRFVEARNLFSPWTNKFCLWYKIEEDLAFIKRRTCFRPPMENTPIWRASINGHRFRLWRELLEVRNVFHFDSKSPAYQKALDALDNYLSPFFRPSSTPILSHFPCLWNSLLGISLIGLTQLPNNKTVYQRVWDSFMQLARPTAFALPAVNSANRFVFSSNPKAISANFFPRCPWCKFALSKALSQVL